MLEINKIYNGDCLDGMKKIPDKSIDLCITSPPYNFDIKYDTYKDLMSWSDYYRWCNQWLSEIFRILKDDGRFVLNHYFSCGTSDERTYPLFILNDIATSIGFKHNSVLFWNDITVVKRTAWGSWLSASSPYINSPFEGFLILYKNQWKKKNKGINTINKKDFMRMCSGIIIDSPNRDKLHPATFPLKTAKLFVEGLSFQDDIVIDPFIGSGTTAIACINTKRKYIGFELSTQYVDIANERIKEAKQFMKRQVI